MTENKSDLFYLLTLSHPGETYTYGYSHSSSHKSLFSETRGHVWTMTTRGNRPEGDVAIVSTLNQGAVIQYRVVSERLPQRGAEAVEPTLEDSYVWLMHARRIPVSMTTL